MAHRRMTSVHVTEVLIRWNGRAGSHLGALIWHGLIPVSGLHKELRLYGQNSGPESFASKNKRIR
jgi:hypothetical protein